MGSVGEVVSTVVSTLNTVFNGSSWLYLILAMAVISIAASFVMRFLSKDS